MLPRPRFLEEAPRPAAVARRRPSATFLVEERPVGVGKEAFFVVRMRNVVADAATAAAALAVASNMSSPRAWAALRERTSSVSCFVTSECDVPAFPARAVRPQR
eukprot:scaffold97418_cov29-Tisochrysis_lutea.AAC.2